MSKSMFRYNEGKPKLSYLPTAFLNAIYDNTTFEGPTKLAIDVARVLEFGAKKYAPNNWRSGGSWLAVCDSALRHLLWYNSGEQFDSESGLHHLAHLGCNIAFLLEFIQEETGVDDRYATRPRTVATQSQLDDVCQNLLMWRDGGAVATLQEAARSLAYYYEGLEIEEPVQEVRNDPPPHTSYDAGFYVSPQESQPFLPDLIPSIDSMMVN